jgi:hypothetical protein
MVFVHPMPKGLNRRMAFADYDDAEIPIGEPLLQQPLRSMRTDLDGPGESFACRSGLLR